MNAAACIASNGRSRERPSPLSAARDSARPCVRCGRGVCRRASTATARGPGTVAGIARGEGKDAHDATRAPTHAPTFAQVPWARHALRFPTRSRRRRSALRRVAEGGRGLAPGLIWSGSRAPCDTELVGSVRNVTVTLDEETARWARVEAAKRDTSLSRLIGEMLETYMREQRGYEQAMRSYRSRGARRLKRSGAYPGREELHDRAGVR